jgi:uncharacterized membrane protein YkoI
MPMFRALFAAAAVFLSASALPVEAQHGREQDEVFKAHQSGKVMSLREIEQRVIPHMSGFDYLGPEFDRGTAIYRLKFMRAGSVIWLDVDGRTGQIIGRTGR